jgi:hypothetical protein
MNNLLLNYFLRDGLNLTINCCIFIGILLSSKLNFYTVIFQIAIILSTFRELIVFRYLNCHKDYIFIYKLCNCLYLLIIFQNIHKAIDSISVSIFYTCELLCLFEYNENNLWNLWNNFILHLNHELNDIVKNNYHTSNGEIKYRYKIFISENDFNQIELCYICYIDKGNHTILNCNHNMICEGCLFKINKCPICRGHIQASIQLAMIS